MVKEMHSKVLSLIMDLHREKQIEVTSKYLSQKATPEFKSQS